MASKAPYSGAGTGGTGEAGGRRGRGQRLIQWLDDRVGFSALYPLAKKKSVPVHKHSIWYYMGGMALFLFILQVCTGILLLFYYRPSAEGAYESVQFLMSSVKFGWLIRSIHAWGANLMILTLFVHLFSTLFLKAYRKPREITWLSGFLLFVLVLGMGFTGYLLPWNQLAFFATRVGTEIPATLPLVGDFIKELFRGGNDVSGATLTRFYALHISVLPGMVILIVLLHVILVQKLGMSVPPGVEAKDGVKGDEPFFPNFLLRDSVGWLAALALLAAAAAFFPAHLGEKADPFGSAPVGIRPEWYFMFMFQTLKMLPARILGINGELVGVSGFALGGLILLVMPFLDRQQPDGKFRKIWRVVGLIALAYIIVLTIVGYSVDPTQ